MRGSSRTEHRKRSHGHDNLVPPTPILKRLAGLHWLQAGILFTFRVARVLTFLPGVVTSLILFVLFVLFGGGVAYGATTAPQRKQYLEQAERMRRRLSDAAPLRDPQIASFWTLLRERTPLAPMTPALAALNALVFVLMLCGTGAMSSPDTVIAWGGNFGPRTTNGEWWRLLTAMFVHGSALHLFADLIGLLAVGVVLERLVGPLAFAVVYVASGVSSIAFGLETSPTGMTVGAAGAIFGLYGLMLTVAVRSALRRSMVNVPLAVAKYLVPIGAAFSLYSLVTGWVASGPELSAFFIGCLSGLVIGRGIGEPPAPAMLTVPIIAGAVVVVVATVWPLRGMTDVRPAIQQLVTTEQKMSARYQRATSQFINGHITADALAAVIDREILPEVQTLHVRFASLQHVPDQQRPLLAVAQKYLQLRDESWRTRSKGLTAGSVDMLRQAERSEMAANDTLREIE